MPLYSEGSAAGLRGITNKYAAAMLILLLNATAGVYIMGLMLYGVIGLFPDLANLSDTTTDAGYLTFMLYNEVASYAVPLAVFPLIFRDALKERTDPGNFLPTNRYKFVFGAPVLLYLTGWLAAVAGGMVTTYLSDFFHSFAGTPEVQTAFSSVMPQTVFRYAVFEICTCIIAPVCEEIIYRYILLKPMRKYGDAAAVFVSALLFGLMHFNLDQFLYSFALGAFIAVIAVRTDSVILPIVFHVLNNVIAGISVYMPETFGSDALDAFFGAAASFMETLSAVMLYLALASAGAVILLRLLRLRNNCGIPVKAQFGVIFRTPVFDIAAVLCIAFAVYKLFM